MLATQGPENMAVEGLRTMKWSRFTIVALSALIVVLVFFPGVGATIRYPLEAVLGESWSDRIGAIASIIGIAYLLFDLGRWISAGNPERIGGDGESPSINTSPTSTPGSTERKRKVQDDADKLARRISDLASNYRKRSPFRQMPLNMNMESPEGQEISRRYDAQKDEMRGKYRREMLPEVIRVKGALADLGLTDAQLDSLYQRPRTFDEMEAVAARLWDMGGKLDRRIQ